MRKFRVIKDVVSMLTGPTPLVVGEIVDEVAHPDQEMLNEEEELADEPFVQVIHKPTHMTAADTAVDYIVPLSHLEEIK